MAHYEARMSSKGQVTIPAKIREALDLKEGDTIDFYLHPGSRTVKLIARNKSFADLRGILADHVDQTTLPRTGEAFAEWVDQAIAEHLAEKFERVDREWKEWREFEAWKAARKKAEVGE